MSEKNAREKRIFSVKKVGEDAPLYTDCIGFGCVRLVFEPVCVEHCRMLDVGIRRILFMRPSRRFYRIRASIKTGWFEQHASVLHWKFCRPLSTVGMGVAPLAVGHAIVPRPFCGESALDVDGNRRFERRLRSSALYWMVHSRDDRGCHRNGRAASYVAKMHTAIQSANQTAVIVCEDAYSFSRDRR